MIAANALSTSCDHTSVVVAMAGGLIHGWTWTEPTPRS
jgi:hypothetical protein